MNTPCTLLMMQRPDRMPNKHQYKGGTGLPAGMPIILSRTYSDDSQKTICGLSGRIKDAIPMPAYMEVEYSNAANHPAFSLQSRVPILNISQVQAADERMAPERTNSSAWSHRLAVVKRINQATMGGWSK